MTRRTTERERQAFAAATAGERYTWTFHCDDGEVFSAVARTESGAFRVLNAERPGSAAGFIGRGVKIEVVS